MSKEIVRTKEKKEEMVRTKEKEEF